MRRCPVVPPPRIFCPRCERWDVGIPVESGIPDDDLFGRAKRGEAVVRRDVPVATRDDWFCTACGRGFPGECTPGGLRLVAPAGLVRSGYDRALLLLRDRTALTAAVCEALQDGSGDPDAPGVASGWLALRAWISDNYPLAPVRHGVRAGLDRIVVPADVQHLAAVLEAATAVCAALETMPRDPVRVAVGLREYARRRDQPPPPPPSADNRPREDADVVTRATPVNGIDRVIDELLGAGGELSRAVWGPPAPDTADTADPEPDDGWEELLPVASELFRIGSSLEWARHAWASLHRCELTACATEVERARVVVRLVTLNVVHQEFAARAFEDGPPGEWAIDDGAVLGDEPRLDPFLLGMLAERDHIDVDPDVGYRFLEGSPAAHALSRLVRAAYPEVVRALLEDLKKPVLFASLWASAEPGVSYPLHDDAVARAVDDDLSGPRLTAYQWIDEGMPLD